MNLINTSHIILVTSLQTCWTALWVALSGDWDSLSSCNIWRKPSSWGCQDPAMLKNGGNKTLGIIATVLQHCTREADNQIRTLSEQQENAIEEYSIAVSPDESTCRLPHKCEMKVETVKVLYDLTTDWHNYRVTKICWINLISTYSIVQGKSYGTNSTAGRSTAARVLQYHL